MSVRRNLFLNLPATYERLILKKHMHSEPAIKIEKVRMPHDEMTRRRARAPVDGLVSKALMSRMELRSRMPKMDAVQHSK